MALGNLRSFELKKWAADPAATRHDLVLAGASAAVLAAVDAEVAAL